MILKASQRAGALALGRHLLKPENEHVEIHDIRGFVADDVIGAFQEAEAISKGTRCKQFLFSLSLNPPEDANVPPQVFDDVLARIENRLKLDGQPRVVVFHEKEGRRHAHCVWSRIDADTMTAIKMSHFKRKLTSLSVELYVEHQWSMPNGLVAGAVRDPLSFDLREWQQTKRSGHDPRLLKAVFQRAWEISDSGRAFRQAIERHGFTLAQGDRRAVVAIDRMGEVYAVARLTKVHSKLVVARLSDLGVLPTTAEATETIAKRMLVRIDEHAVDLRAGFTKSANALEGRRLAMVAEHRAARQRLRDHHEKRAAEEAALRAARFRRGLMGIWDRLTGRHAKLRAENELDLATTQARDSTESQRLIEQQMTVRRRLQREIKSTREIHQQARQRLASDAEQYSTLLSGTQTPMQSPSRTRRREPSLE